MDDDTLWCPVMGLAHFFAGSLGWQTAGEPNCLGESCGAYNLCSDGGNDEDDFDEDDIPDTVLDGNGDEIDVVPRSKERLNELKGDLVVDLAANSVAYKSITCTDCDGAAMCEFAFYSDNLDGYCEAEK